jgi:hypothetical protein
MSHVIDSRAHETVLHIAQAPKIPELGTLSRLGWHPAEHLGRAKAHPAWQQTHTQPPTGSGGRTGWRSQDSIIHDRF